METSSVYIVSIPTKIRNADGKHGQIWTVGQALHGIMHLTS